MAESVLLVDYENIGKIDLAAIPDGVRVPFFFGASQRTVPTDFLKAALRLGERFVPIDIEGQGKNALDFHIAFYLGEYLARDPVTACVILSKDKGFDPLVRHLARRGFAVRRANTMAEALGARIPPAATPRGPGAVRASAASTASTGGGEGERPRRTRRGGRRAGARRESAGREGGTPKEQALHLLAGTQKARRPRKRKGLIAVLHSHFAQKVPESELQQLVDELIAQGSLSETNGAIAYHFTDGDAR
ncbi:MAG TPA: PIN domain-containing protein [Steroidobacteraceae bacterium]|nr:PIN domain-containing protein [Steroidobacteraceae bacterium]